MSGDGKSKMLMEGDFAPCTFFDQWDQCLDSNGDGVQVKFLVKLHTISSWSPKMSVFGDCGLTQVPQMPNEKMIFDCATLLNSQYVTVFLLCATSYPYT